MLMAPCAEIPVLEKEVHAYGCQKSHALCTRAFAVSPGSRRPVLTGRARGCRCTRRPGKYPYGLGPGQVEAPLVMRSALILSTRSRYQCMAMGMNGPGGVSDSHDRDI